MFFLTIESNLLGGMFSAGCLLSWLLFNIEIRIQEQVTSQSRLLASSQHQLTLNRNLCVTMCDCVVIQCVNSCTLGTVTRVVHWKNNKCFVLINYRPHCTKTNEKWVDGIHSEWSSLTGIQCDWEKAEQNINTMATFIYMYRQNKTCIVIWPWCCILFCFLTAH